MYWKLWDFVQILWICGNLGMHGHVKRGSLSYTWMFKNVTPNCVTCMTWIQICCGNWVGDGLVSKLDCFFFCLILKVEQTGRWPEWDKISGLSDQGGGYGDTSCSLSNLFYFNFLGLGPPLGNPGSATWKVILKDRISASIRGLQNWNLSLQNQQKIYFIPPSPRLG